jgi:hypothetical protein
MKMDEDWFKSRGADKFLRSFVHVRRSARMM